MALNAIQMMSDHVQEFQERFRQLATERVERRLARTILRLASQSGRKTDEGVLIDFPLSRQDLAEMCGTTLYTVSRTLSEWAGKGPGGYRARACGGAFPARAGAYCRGPAGA